MDRAADPCRDFFAYTCGAWGHEHPAPTAEPYWYRGTWVASRMAEEEKSLIAAQPAASPLRRFNAACLAEGSEEAQALSPLSGVFAAIQHAQDPTGLARALGEMHALGVSALFATKVVPDPQTAKTNVLLISRSALPLGGSKLYTPLLAASGGLSSAYAAHVAAALSIAPFREPVGADAVVAFESNLAAEQERKGGEPKPTSMAALEDAAPTFDWRSYFKARAIEPAKVKIWVEPEALATLADPDMVASTPALRSYLDWSLLHAVAPLLNGAVSRSNFDLFQHRLSGAQAAPPRWRICVDATASVMEQRLTRLYAAKHVSPRARRSAAALAQDLKRVFAHRIASLPWLSPQARDAAMEKLARIRFKLGAPAGATWVEPAPPDGPLLAQWAALRRTTTQAAIHRLGRAVNQREWGRSPLGIGAMYDPARNDVLFTAGMLQPPYLDPDADPAALYGSLGVVIGHELTHGFDAAGRLFDSRGRRRDWWLARDLEAFKARSQCLIREYGAQSLASGLATDGVQTLNENTADNGGLDLAHDALLSRLKRKPLRAKYGLSPEQRFFVAFGQAWCNVTAPEEQTRRVLSDTHALARFRVEGAIRNSAAFSKAFQCPAAKAPQCKVW